MAIRTPQWLDPLEKERKWHRWFALSPVETLDEGEVWLRWIWRIGIRQSFCRHAPLHYVYRVHPPDAAADDDNAEGVGN